MSAFALLLFTASAPIAQHAPDEHGREEHGREKLTLAFRATPGKVLEKDYEHCFELGTSLGAAFLREERRTVLRDRYVQVAEVGVVELVRRFERVTATWGGLDEVRSPLQEEEVRFAFDPELGRHVASFVEPAAAARSGVDERQLPLLEVDTDLVGFLPPRPVAIGETWLVPSEALRRVLNPGGTYVYVSEEERVVARSSARGPAEDEDDAGLRARLAEVTRFGADRIAVVALEGELEYELEFLGPLYLGSRRDPYGYWGYAMNVPRRALFRFSVEGTLRWNVDSGHLDELHLSADLDLLQDRTTMESVLEALRDAFEPWPWIRGDPEDLYEIDPSRYDANHSYPTGELSIVLRVFC